MSLEKDLRSMSALFEVGARPPGAFAGRGEPPQESSERPLFRAAPGALGRWERDSAEAEPLGLFQTAAWALLLGAYDRATGRSPLLLGPPGAEGESFALPLSLSPGRVRSSLPGSSGSRCRNIREPSAHP
jgi:hypothetical protein